MSSPSFSAKIAFGGSVYCFNTNYRYSSIPNNPDDIEATAEREPDINLEISGLRAPHDYVIVDDIDAAYLEIERRKIETETYYRTIDRATAEDVLAGRENGTCLVRPYKETDICIKYVVSIYAQRQYFHLFIRQIRGKELYAIGQEKPNEKLFHSPSDIIDFYSCNTLQCTNKQTTLNLVLKPIIV